MQWHAIVVQVDRRWKCGADLVNEYLRLFRHDEDWPLMREDLTELLECRGLCLDLLIGPDPGKGEYIPQETCHDSVLRILYISKLTIPARTGMETPAWYSSAVISTT